jgi:predicted RND superfamily exporter protein
VDKEGMTWGLDTAIRGASERLIPILMTATVTALGLLPLALGTGEAGREIEGPMAIVILGGLVTTTVLNLFVLPTLALRYGRFVPERHDHLRPDPGILCDLRAESKLPSQTTLSRAVSTEHPPLSPI